MQIVLTRTTHLRKTVSLMLMSLFFDTAFAGNNPAGIPPQSPTTTTELQNLEGTLQNIYYQKEIYHWLSKSWIKDEIGNTCCGYHTCSDHFLSCLVKYKFPNCNLDLQGLSQQWYRDCWPFFNHTTFFIILFYNNYIFFLYLSIILLIKIYIIITPTTI